MMGGLIAAAFQSGYRTKELVETEADRYRGLRTGTDRMVREISAAFVSDHYDLQPLPRPERPAHQLHRHPRPAALHQHGPPAPLRRRQGVGPDGGGVLHQGHHRPGGQSRTDLVRRENPSLDDRMDRGGHEDVLVEGVKRDRLRLLGLGQEGLGGRVGHPAGGAEVHPPGAGADRHRGPGRDGQGSRATRPRPASSSTRRSRGSDAHRQVTARRGPADGDRSPSPSSPRWRPSSPTRPASIWRWR